MDPISVAVELELAMLLLAAVGGIATFFQNRNNARTHAQRAAHHREQLMFHERLHAETLKSKIEPRVADK